MDQSQGMMSNQFLATPSGAPSPSNQPFPQDLFPLDFLSFVEGTSPSVTMGMGDFQLPSPGQSGPNQQPGQQHSQSGSYTSSPIFDSRADSVGRSPRDGIPPSRGGSSKGRSRSRAPKKASSTSQGISGRRNLGQDGMDLDLDTIMNMGDLSGMDGKNGQQSQMSQEEINMRMAQLYGIQSMDGLEGYMDANAGMGLPGMSQGMLQQFEGIHMQSPIIFDPNNPSQAYNPMAQFLASPPSDGNRKGSIHMMNGLITPGASTEMYPQSQSDQMMSPMQLEMLARREQMEGMPDLNILPLLSPALNNQNQNQHHRSSSQYSSPALYPTFNPSPNHSGSIPNGQTPLEALQEQSRQFQTQLNALQVQQRQLQATAAAVAASSAQSSPYINSHSANGTFPSSGSSGHSRLVTTPGGGAEPSPQYFTPLTSPALEATRQFQSMNGNGHSSNSNSNGNGNGQYQRHPHPLSALSSPALNPIGSAGGAQQTLSPAIHAQSGAELSDPDYLRALVGMFESPSGSSQAQGSGPNRPMENAFNGNGNQQYQSPSLNAQYPFQQQQPQSHSNHIYTNGLAPSSGPLSSGGSGGSSNGHSTTTGPHRHPLPSKSRPSPLVKPINHRSHIRTPSMHQSFSQPSSPAILKGIQPGTYLPAAAMDQRHGGGGSQTSTPSPVDLTSIMPPPPVPVQHSQKAKGLTPMTPAALMNLGGGPSGKRQVLPKADTQAASKPATGGTKAASKKAMAANAASAATANATASASGSAPGAAGTPSIGKKGGRVATGKKLAARPSAVGVRSATKGAAAAAIALQSPIIEPENRRTSHKAAEQKRRDSLKAGFDELRLLLPPINTEALDPESGEPIPGSSAPRLLPKSSLVPDDAPNRGVSKVALLKFSNEYIVKLHEKIDRREDYVERLRMEVERLRGDEGGEMVKMEDGVDLLEFDIHDGEEEDEEGEGEEGEEEDEEEADGEDEMEELDEDDGMEEEEEIPVVVKKSSRRNTINGGRKSTGSTAAGKRPSVGRRESSGGTVTPRNRKGD